MLYKEWLTENYFGYYRCETCNLDIDVETYNLMVDSLDIQLDDMTYFALCPECNNQKLVWVDPCSENYC